MSILTNSIRPSSLSTKSPSVAGKAYSAYKLQGSCSRCFARSYQVVVTSHPIFKMACPECKAWLDERKATAKQLEINKLLAEEKTP